MRARRRGLRGTWWCDNSWRDTIQGKTFMEVESLNCIRVRRTSSNC
jgi:hypothetical protein